MAVFDSLFSSTPPLALSWPTGFCRFSVLRQSLSTLINADWGLFLLEHLSLLLTEIADLDVDVIRIPVAVGVFFKGVLLDYLLLKLRRFFSLLDHLLMDFRDSQVEVFGFGPSDAAFSQLFEDSDLVPFLELVVVDVPDNLLELEAQRVVSSRAVVQNAILDHGKHAEHQTPQQEVPQPRRL